jgi:DNA-binding NtrC family response regulator
MHPFLRSMEYGEHVAKILVIEEDLQYWENIRSKLETHHKLYFWTIGRDIGEHLKEKDYEVVLLSFSLHGADSFSLLEQIRQVSPHTPVIAVSAHEDADLIVRTVKKGVFDFVVKPFTTEKIMLSVRRGIETRILKNEIDYLKRSQDYIYDFGRIIAESPSMSDVIVTLKKFARTDATILITGETGTGKSFLSGAVHYNSDRRDKPFIKINCANLPETLLESELFGHEKGSFTGANKTRVGRLEQAKDGTVFLDEIGEMSASLQAKLLRVLEEKSFERVGGNKTIYSDVRIIAATNRKPEVQVANGSFREDLYYRLNVLRIHLPPLRDRRECVEPLAHYLLAKICRNLRKKISGFTPEVKAALQSYSWPGNIRQLANTIERAAILEDSPVVRLQHIILPDVSAPETAAVNGNGAGPPASAELLVDKEKEAILSALEGCLWIQKDAAHRLGISPRALNYKIRKFGITHPRWRKNK